MPGSVGFDAIKGDVGDRPAADLAPGSILQRMFLRERLRRRFETPIQFLEVGAGKGYTSQLLLGLGHQGAGIDLNPDACALNRGLNSEAIARGNYRVDSVNFLEYPAAEASYDLILSCMVIEHLSPEDLAKYFRQAVRLLKPGGVVIQLVPASMKFWGIEDEIAGHYKRYTRSCFEPIASACGLRVHFIAGLTYPISNLLLPLGNHLVTRAESGKKDLSMIDRTVQSGNREVPLKTSFPHWMTWVLNPVTLYPLHVLQKMFRNHADAMVLYCEFEK